MRQNDMMDTCYYVLVFLRKKKGFAIVFFFFVFINVYIKLG